MAEGLELYEQPLAPTIGIQAQLPILLSDILSILSRMSKTISLAFPARLLLR